MGLAARLTIQGDGKPREVDLEKSGGLITLPYTGDQSPVRAYMHPSGNSLACNLVKALEPLFGCILNLQAWSIINNLEKGNKSSHLYPLKLVL